jgi:Fe-S oxidoreductase
VIRALSGDFVDLEPNRAENWCCGGGGGLVAMGEQDFRMKSARVKADQLRATGARTMITACENCHSQLSDLNGHYGLGLDVRFLSDVLADALLPPDAP